MTELLSRLNNKIVDSIKDAEVGIIHLGLGAFHKAHQAWYTHNAMLADGGNWKITGVSLRSANVANEMLPQNCLYTVVVKDSERVTSNVVSSIDNVLVAPHSPLKIIQALADEKVKVVTLTITEKGYCHDPASGKLKINAVDIQHDLNHLDSPKTAIGILVSAIYNRISNNASPFTVISCDNLPNNGTLLRNLVLEFAGNISPELASNIADNYSFPSSMVDRIVPAVTQESKEHLYGELGYRDEALVITENFSQWVIEDNFVSDRPSWEMVGVLFVDDVQAYETMKLRLLNGSHSAIAYIGFLSQLETVSDAIANIELANFIKSLMTLELRPSLHGNEQVNLDQYCETLLERFSNTALQHRTYQIAMDGSQKIPQRLLEALQYQVMNKGNYNRICFVIASWMLFTRGEDLLGNKFDVQDPLSHQLLEAYKKPKTSGNAQDNDQLKDWVTNFLSIKQVFNEDIANNQGIQKTIYHWLTIMSNETNICECLNKIDFSDCATF